MQSMRLLLSILFSAVAVTCLVFLTINGSGLRRHLSHQSNFNTLFFFQSPASLFSPSATISLTDDNSTFFASRPAAFGPVLPTRGLSGQLWVGSGFGDDSIHSEGFEGELGCGDVHGFARTRSEYATNDASRLDHTASSALESVKEYDSEYGGDYNAKSPVNIQDFTDSRLAQDINHIPGKIVLLRRGGCGFSEKVKWAQNRGAIAVIIGDYAKGGPLVRMYARGDTSNITIPSLFTSHTTAHLLSSLTPDIFGTPDIFEKGIIQNMGSVLSSNAAEREKDENRIESLRGLSSNRQRRTDDTIASLKKHRKIPKEHQGLWVTLTPSDMNSSPFFHTLFVLVVSPLLTLIIVYSMLLLRSRIRRRRWRAPKSVVERLPVRTYHTFSTCPSFTALETAAQDPSTSATPLLASIRREEAGRDSHSRTEYERPRSTSSVISGGVEPVAADSEKLGNRVVETGRRFTIKQMECVVCLEEYVDGVSRVMSLPCGHEFHAECITPWLTTRRRTCPICKGDVVRSMRRREASCSTRSNAEDYDLMEDGEGDFNEADIRAGPIHAEPTQIVSSEARDSPRNMQNHDFNRGQQSVTETEAPSTNWITRYIGRGWNQILHFSPSRGQGDTNSRPRRQPRS